jgi:hypothetical protein
MQPICHYSAWSSPNDNCLSVSVGAIARSCAPKARASLAHVEKYMHSAAFAFKQAGALAPNFRVQAGLFADACSWPVDLDLQRRKKYIQNVYGADPCRGCVTVRICSAAVDFGIHVRLGWQGENNDKFLCLFSKVALQKGSSTQSY